jgi:pyridoxal phosphate enzyme (YggS family)
MSIQSNIEFVRETIEKSAVRSGRRGSDVKLLAVTKTVESARIWEAVEAGISDIGENRVQEYVSKRDFFGENVRWHMIGRLQKNKIKYIIGKISLVHSLSSIDAALEIQRLSKREGICTPCLVQVNVGEEGTKSGLRPEDTLRFIESLASLDSLRVQGLMAIAPAVDDPEKVRPYFAQMRELYETLPTGGNVEKRWLSMGMSGDYAVAVEEGANIVRVGSLIFGKRN